MNHPCESHDAPLSAHPDRHHALSRPWLRALIVQCVAGDLDPHPVQQLVAYYAWKRRTEYLDKGDSLTDWLEAADLLNMVAEACEQPVLPW